MAKQKNKGNKKTWNQAINPWLRRNRGWLSAIGGAIGGATLLSAFTSQRERMIVNELATSVKSFVPQGKPESDTKFDSASKSKPAASA